MLGYYEEPKQTEEAITVDGWLHTGDIGVINSQGYLSITDRSKDMFTVGGFNTYPAEIENILYKNKYVEECAVIGINDKMLGQNVCAFIQLRKNNIINEGDIISFCKGKINAYKIPKKIVFINDLDDMNEIPKGPTKKILYRELEEYYKNLI